MHITFFRNIHFTKLLKTADRLREFNFRLLPGADHNLFHVDVPDERGNRIVFRMHKEAGAPWRIQAQQLPAWITDNEKRLHELIEGEMG